MLGTDLGVAQATTCFTFPHLDPQPDLFCLKSAILEPSVTNTQQPPAFWGVITFDTVLAPKPVTSGLARAPTPLTQPINYAAGLSHKSVPSPPAHFSHCIICSFGKEIITVRDSGACTVTCALEESPGLRATCAATGDRQPSLCKSLSTSLSSLSLGLVSSLRCLRFGCSEPLSGIQLCVF